MKKKLYIPLIALLLTLFFFGCSRKKNSFLRRAYHNTTARYNGYFNAKEIKKKNLIAIYANHKDDYSEILPLFIYPTESQSKAMYPDMDLIIEKCSEVIERHSMHIKKEEHNRWIDNCYMLIGQARFYKQEYYVGEEVFTYVAKAYKKKPSHFEGLIWLIRTYLEVDDLLKAESYLDVIDQQTVPKEFSSEYNALYAEYYIRKRNYDDAIKRLTKSLETTHKRKDRRRYTYVLAQLWLKKKEYGQASRLFTQVIKLKPDYDMMFHAKMHRALSYDVGAEGNEKIKKMLLRMAKDRKNEEFYDQIYYVLADIALKDKNEPLAIRYLHQSAALSINNDKQKALSYLRLGELYYEKPQYIPAQAYYDSCLTVLPQDYVGYDKVADRSAALTKLVTNITTVTLEDSLQLMATDDNYRKKAIANMVQQVLDAERLALNEELSAAAENPSFTSSTTKGGWYFYNQTTLTFGFNDFKKNWGIRKLEDDWRRTDRQSIATFEDEDQEQDSLKTDSIISNEKTDPNYYLQFLPLTEEKMSISHNKIIEALYALGNIYREDFKDYPNATKSFEELVERYDTCRYKLPSWYNLYRISLLTDNDVMKKKYKTLILNNFPESEYARIIQDPSYNKVTRENRKRVDNYYSRVYDLYSDKHFKKVLIRCKKAKSIFADNHIQDQFDFLYAMAIGHTNTLDSFQLALKQVIALHPNSEVSTEAQRILDLIAKNKTEKVITSTSLTAYQHDPSESFIFVAVIPLSDKMGNSYKNNISDFNQKYYSSTSFDPVKSIILNKEFQIITVKKMTGINPAIDYYDSFFLNTSILKSLNEKKYTYFLISEKNFITFYKDKNIDDYLKFFTKNFNVTQ